MMESGPQLTVDPQAGAAYVKLSDNEIVSSVPRGEAFVVDLDQHGVAVGLEILDLDAEIPFSDLTSKYHVHSTRIETLRHLRPTIRGFLSLQVGAQIWTSASTAALPVPC